MTAPLKSINIEAIPDKQVKPEVKPVSWRMRVVYVLNWMVEGLERGYNWFSNRVLEEAFRVYTYLFGKDNVDNSQTLFDKILRKAEVRSSIPEPLSALPLLPARVTKIYGDLFLPFMVGILSPNGSLFAQNLLLQQWGIHPETSLKGVQPKTTEAGKIEYFITGKEQNARLAKALTPSFVIGKGCQLFEAASGFTLPVPVKGVLLVITSSPQVQEKLASNAIVGPLISTCEEGLNWAEEKAVSKLTQGYTKLIFWGLNKGKPYAKAEIDKLNLPEMNMKGRWKVTTWLLNLAIDGAKAEGERMAIDAVAKTVTHSARKSAKVTTYLVKMWLLQYLAFSYARKGSDMQIRNPLWLGTLIIGNLATERNASDAAMKVGSLGVLYRTRSPFLAASSYVAIKVGIFAITFLMKGHYHQMLQKRVVGEESTVSSTQDLPDPEPLFPVL